MIFINLHFLSIYTGACGMDLVAVSCLNPLLRCLLCCWSWLHTLDDHRRTLFTRASTSRYECCCTGQLER